MEKIIKLTPISEVLTKDEITKLKKALKTPPSFKLTRHNCHHNSYFIGLFIRNSLGYEVNVCQGCFCYGMDHSWNSITKNGVRYYVDFTSEWVNKEDVSNEEYEMTLEISLDACGKIFRKEGNSFIILTGFWDDRKHIGVWYDEDLNRHTTNDIKVYCERLGFTHKK
jgi:hypothetical protein